MPDELEADFRSVYGIKLGGLWRGDMTVREAAVLAAQLPAGSRVWVALNHDLAWTTDQYLQAVGIDQARTSEKQKPVPRPYDTRKRLEYVRKAQEKAERFAGRTK